MLGIKSGRELCALIIAVTVSACSVSHPALPRQFVDLSPSIGSDLVERQLGPTIAGAGYIPEPYSEHIIEEGDDFYSVMSVVTMLNHLGSHADPPRHVFREGKSIDQLPLDRFYGEIVFFDFRAKARNHPLSPADFQSKVIEPDSIVIAFVGYEAPSAPGELPTYPYLTGEAAKYLASLEIKAFGTDMPGLMSIVNSASASNDDTSSGPLFEEHTALLEKEIVVIEGLSNLDALVDLNNVVFVGFPIKLEGGTGGPMRAVGLVY